MQNCRLFLICSLLLVAWAGSAAGQSITYQETIGGPDQDYAYSVIKTVDEGSLICGDQSVIVPM